MKKLFLFIPVLILVLVGGALFYSRANQKDSTAMRDDTASQTEGMKDSEAKDTAMAQNTPSASDTMTESGKYIPYSPEALQNTATSRRVLFFYASWCPTCKPADKSFSDNLSKIPANVTLIRVNYNDPDTDEEEKALAKKYGVTYQHTFIQIDDQGKEVTKWNGGQIDELLSNLQ